MATKSKNCGPACTFCGACGKKFNGLPAGMQIPVVAPPGVKDTTTVNADDIAKVKAAISATNEAGAIIGEK